MNGYAFALDEYNLVKPNRDPEPNFHDWVANKLGFNESTAGWHNMILAVAIVHDEFAARHLFIKHRPTWKWTFYSLIGMGDLKIEDLSEEKRFEQRMFDEFVKEKGVSR